jgi:HPt (histidine-containing phosphotransfer) domain-containing protein
MAQVAIRTVDKSAGPPPVAAIDRDHLRQMTFGDRSLERELLELFDRQAVILIERMQAGDAASAGALAHTLKGSALGIGAVAVARTAEAVERGATLGDQQSALERLAAAVAEARGEIAQLLRAG